MRSLLLAAALATISSPISAANYVANFSGAYGDGSAFSGSITYDLNKITELHNHAVVSFTLNSDAYVGVFGRAVVSSSDFVMPNEYVFTVTTQAYGNALLSTDHLAFALQPYRGDSSTLGFSVEYALGTLTWPLTSAPASSQIVSSSAGYVGFSAPYNFGGTISSFSITPVVTADLPEPGTWAMMIAGFGLTGATMRRRQVAAIRLA